MRSVEWTQVLEQYLTAYHCAVVNYQVTADTVRLLSSRDEGAPSEQLTDEEVPF